MESVFIATGTILVTDRQEVKGLTTAAALWASACMGLAIGVGFYECVAVGILLIFSVHSRIAIFLKTGFLKIHVI